MDNYSLAIRHSYLLNDIMVCDNMIDSEEVSDKSSYVTELENMVQELKLLEEIMTLKNSVDCDCFYMSRDERVETKLAL